MVSTCIVISALYLKSKLKSTSSYQCLSSYNKYIIMIQQNYFVYEPAWCQLNIYIYLLQPNSCLSCDSGQPRADLTKIYVNVHPGVIFSLPFVVVRGDLGTRLGSTHATFKNPERIVPTYQYVQWMLQCELHTINQEFT